MKYIILILSIFCLTGCFGFSSKQNELTGQVKKVKHQTPMLCPERVDVDVSLGVLRNGVGSMSTEDLWLTVDNPNDIEILTKAAETGQIVKVSYDVRRVTFCPNEDLVTHVEVSK